jgi:hypothetical protein
MTELYLKKINSDIDSIVELFIQALKTNSYESKNHHGMTIGKYIARHCLFDEEYRGPIIDKDQMIEIKNRFIENINKFDNFKFQTIKVTDKFPYSLNKFQQYWISDSYSNEIVDSLPEYLKILNPKPSLQIASGGNYTMIHSDHDRLSSLFYLYTDSNEITRWYEKLSDFNITENRLADPSKVQEVFSAQIQKHHWYCFNHEQYHSVHSANSDTKMSRINFLLEFENLRYSDLLNHIKNSQ